MINITSFIEKFLNTLDNIFGSRVWFVGLQGSYSRGEATENSDVDMVVILDDLTADDIKIYNDMLDTLPHREHICGFLSGREELLGWEPSDLFQLYNDTTPLKGNLDEILLLIDDDAVCRAIKMGLCNIYHGCVHNMLYEKSDEILKVLYKSATFVIQAMVFRQTGRYVRSRNELLCVVQHDEQNILNTFVSMKKGDIVDFDKMSEALFVWCKNNIIKMK